MYKVFIDNKVNIFTKTWKKTRKTLDFVMVSMSNPDKLNLVKCRNELPNDVILVVKTNNPEATISVVFSGYEFVEAAGGIVKRKNKFLFIERHGLWDIPKGKMETGEKPAETAVREIEEECGIEKPVIYKLLGITYHTYEFHGKPTLKRNWWYALDYNGPKELKPQTEEAITQAVWLTKKEWKTVRENTYASIAEVLDLY
jgi:8-oxo-dGTP pyrophosphatase MutT (NUDIX family)